MEDAAMAVEYHELLIDGLEVRHVVAKVRRLSSPPVLPGSVEDARASALGRLADILRCGRHSRSHADFVRYKKLMKEDPRAEWAACEEAVRLATGLPRLGHWRPPHALVAAAGTGALRVSYHDAEMSGRPYRLARVGPVLGSPAAILLLPPEDVRGSALDRLADVFRIGTRGRCHADFAASLREAGRDEGAIRAEWGRCEAAVVLEMTRHGREDAPAVEDARAGAAVTIWRTTMIERHSCRFRYWDYAEPGPAALAMLGSGPLRDRLNALLEEGDADDIEEWLKTAEVPDEVKEVLRRGLRGEWVYDAVEVGQLVWHDHLSTVTTCVAQRKEVRVLYRAWQDGELVGEHLADAELDGEEVRNLMVTGDIRDGDYTGKASFEASSAFHPDLEDFDGWEEPDDED